MGFPRSSVAGYWFSMVSPIDLSGYGTEGCVPEVAWLVCGAFYAPGPASNTSGFAPLGDRSKATAGAQSVISTS